MSAFNYEVNPEELEQDFEIVPAGDYLAVIESSELSPTKDGTGTILKLVYQIIEGNMKSRKIFNNINLENNGPKKVKTEQIAKRTMNSIGVATGVFSIKDSSQLHNIPMKITVKVSDNDTYGKQNKITKHEPAEGAAVTSPATQASSQAPAEAAPAKRPWEKP